MSFKFMSSTRSQMYLIDFYDFMGMKNHLTVIKPMYIDG